MRHMLKQLKWIIANLYGLFFGWPLFAPWHRALLVLSLHGLGYNNCWKPSLTGEAWFIRNVLKPAGIQVCFDVGANVGTYSEHLVRELGATVYAFEPGAAAFARLEALAQKYTPHIIPKRLAVSDTNGESVLFLDADLSEKASLDAAVHQGTQLRTETVPTERLDTTVQSLQLTRIDFIKIDTEGFEREVLQGAQRTLRTLRPRFVQFEFNSLHLRRSCSLFDITSLLPGYVFYRLMPHGFIRIEPSHFSANIYVYCNIVAIQP